MKFYQHKLVTIYWTAPWNKEYDRPESNAPKIQVAEYDAHVVRIENLFNALDAEGWRVVSTLPGPKKTMLVLEREDPDQKARR